MVRLAFDLDGVVIDSYERMQKRLYNNFGINFERENHHSYDFNVPGVSEREVINVINESVVYDTHLAKPMSDAIEALQEVYTRTLTPLIFITARPRKAELVTRIWLSKYLKGVPFILYLTDYEPKNYFIKKHNITGFVDDRYKTTLEVAPIVDKMYLFDSPWNRNRPLPNDNIIRIKSLLEII